ncbi:Os08g0448500 [Oryza sativa Japonica Group]|uniref:Os08g0448500 protein n=1 Tax=Oryza sativa subsp. japonica TaxID=39947 RepID=A0A0P0XG88_ORYSJ|nr:Os08g0448500 [Oryza sativa Japonica Group]
MVLPAPLAACGLPPARPPCGLAGRWQSSRRRTASPPRRRRFPAGWPARPRPPPVPTPPRRCAAACGTPVSPRRALVSASPPLAGRLPSPPSAVALRAPPTRQARVRNGRYARSQGAERIGDLGMHGLEWPGGLHCPGSGSGVSRPPRPHSKSAPASTLCRVAIARPGRATAVVSSSRGAAIVVASSLCHAATT